MPGEASPFGRIEEGLRRQLESAWAAGTPEPIENHLPEPGAPDFLARLAALVALEMEFSWGRWAAAARRSAMTGEERSKEKPPLVESYLARFPPLDRPDLTLRLLAWERLVRKRSGDSPTIAEYRRRFPHVIETGREFQPFQQTLGPAAARSGVGLPSPKRAPAQSSQGAAPEATSDHPSARDALLSEAEPDFSLQGIVGYLRALDPTGDQKLTGVGCLLLLATVPVALAAAAAIGLWVAPYLLAPWMLKLPKGLALLIGVVLFGPVVLVGLLFFGGLGGLLRKAGVPITRPRRKPAPAETPEGAAGSVTLGVYVLTEEEDRLVIRQRRDEYVGGLIICLLLAPLFGGLLCLLVPAEIREPGHWGKTLLAEKFGLGQLNPILLRILAVVCSLAILLLFGLLTWFVCRELYRKLFLGRAGWVFDRRKDVFAVRGKPVRALSTVAHVALSLGGTQSRAVFYVGFEPEIARGFMETLFLGLRDDLFSFRDDEAAVQFADAVADFLGVDVVRGDDL